MLRFFLFSFSFTIAAFGQTPTVAAVTNAASYTTQVCPGVNAIIFGTNFGSGATSSVTVMVGGKMALTEFVSPTEVAVQIPFELSPGPTTLTVALGGATSAPFSITLVAVAPAMYTINATGSGLASVLTIANAAPTFGAPVKPGDTLSAYVTGLGVTNPPTATGVAAKANPPAVTPTLTVGGASAKILAAVTAPGNAGLFQINFTVPAGLQGTQPIVLTSGTVSSSSTVTLPIAGVTDVVSNGGFGSVGLAAPGEIATVFANGLGTTDQITGFPATTFQGAQVTFNGTPAPMFHLVASTGQLTKTTLPMQQQIDLLVPQELPTSGTVNVQLTTPTALYPNYTLKMAAAVPGLYRIQDPTVTTRFNIIAQFANTAWLALPNSTTTGLKLPLCTSTTNVLSTCGQPATIGDYLVIYITGLGVTTPGGDPNGKPLTTGQIAPADGSVLYETPTQPTVTIGGIQSKVLYSGLAPGYPGEYQLDVQVPNGVTNSDDTPVVVTMAGNSDTATVSIQPRAQ